MELRTLHGEDFDLKIKRWWSRKERRYARLTLKLIDSQAGVFKEHTHRACFKKKWMPDG